ncbi:MAG: divalent metal cation transporter [Acetobacteraceae bacterium]|nr:divalent metal cation transporter [Acetobacteraceae bacterium]
MPDGQLRSFGTVASSRPRRPAPSSLLGPGLISGAADDDPSGIATYSQAGAQLGYGVCWVLLLCYPMMVVTQEISARIGRATGDGIVAALREHYPRWSVYAVVAAVVFANTINLGADLGAMADVLRLMIGGPRLAYVALFATVCVGLLLRLRLRLYVQFVKWAALSLVVYVLAAINGLLHPVAAPPVVQFDASAVTTLVAVLGTTISPYLFVWQSSLEGERARELGGRHASDAAGSPASEMRRIRADTCVGMAVAALVACAVVVTAASTLHASGISVIETTAQAAEELRRVAGPWSRLLFSVGILATGLLAVPMLAGSAAFAVGEGMCWPVGLARPPGEARAFHECILAATATGVAMNVLNLDPVRALLWSAIINGLLAAPVLIAVMLIARRREIMGQLTLSRPLQALGWLSTLVMAATAVALLATMTI